VLTLFIFKLVSLVTTAAVSSGAAVGVWYLSRRWRLQLSDLALQQTTAFAQQAVLATEQRYKDAPPSAATNQQKLDFATRTLLGHVRRVGIKLDRRDAEVMIEAQVNRLRSQGGVTTEALPPVAKRALEWTARDR